jgi:hypothetical protein
VPSGAGFRVIPGGSFVVELAPLEAVVEMPDPAVDELPQCLAVGLPQVADPGGWRDLDGRVIVGGAARSSAIS